MCYLLLDTNFLHKLIPFASGPDVSLDEGFLNDSLRMSSGALPLRGPPIWVEEESWTTGGHHSSHPSSYKGKKLSAIFHVRTLIVFSRKTQP